MTTDAAEPIDSATTLTSVGEQSADAAAQSELDLGVVSTGSPEVDRALEPLESLADQPVANHAETFERVLGDLAETMTGPGVPSSGAAVDPAAVS